MRRLLLSPPPSPPSHSNPFDFTSKVSPNILLIFIILAIIFFICSLLHLLVRFLLTPSNRVDPDETDENATAFQGPLQHLFNLHDSGVDQSFIDTLPVFSYKEVIGVKDPFDCAVCLCEFDGEDKLRLLPKCSHAFHMDCIDTWLLSHSTCPLCRACLVDDSWMNSGVNCSHVVHVLESGRSTAESSREIGSCSNLSNCDVDLGEIQEKDDKVVFVKLGKFRSVDGGVASEEGIIGNGNSDARRCFSMGSFAYVMDEHSSLQVPIRTPVKKQSSNKPYLPNRMTMSECGCDSRREFNGFEAFRAVENDQSGSKSIGRSKRESSSLSSTGGLMESWRRAFSFRFPAVERNRGVCDELNDENGGSSAWRTISEMEVCRWDDGGSEVGSEAKAPSSGKKTLSWLLRST